MRPAAFTAETNEDRSMANNRRIKKANHGKRPRCNKARKSKRLKA